MKSLKNRNARETVLNIINKYYDHEDECLSERNGLKGLNVNVAAMNTICLIPGKMY